MRNNERIEAQRQSGSGRSTRIGRQRTPVRVIAIGASLALHFVLGTAALFLVLQRPATGRAGNEGIELAVMTDLELQDLQAVLSDSTQLEVTTAAPDESLMTGEMPDPEAFSLRPDSVPSVMGGAGAAASGETEGMDLGALGSGGASFFGVEAIGSRFAYIIDVSGSMTGDRLVALKRQLLSSVDGLLDHASFSIVLYSSDARVLGGKSAWVSATPQNKRDVALEIRGIDASGGTNPLPAFEKVFALDPRPDAIYFMTDGEFPDEKAVIGRISIMNGSGRRRTPVHCIAFESQVSEDVMKRIAKISGGSYIYVAGPGS